MSSLLLVEDDKRLHQFLVPGLKAEGYLVTTAETAQEGFEFARKEPYDALILDIMLPDYSGRELCKQLRGANIGAPLLFLTALSSTEDKVDGLRDGADDYLPKPFDFDELLARIEALIRRARPDSNDTSTTLCIGDICLDVDAHTVTRGGERIDLTDKEFQLLYLLMSSAGKVVSRTRILNKIWGYESDPLTNVVDVNIQRIRARFNWKSENGWIKTVRGYGYLFQNDT